MSCGPFSTTGRVKAAHLATGRPGGALLGTGPWGKQGLGQVSCVGLTFQGEVLWACLGTLGQGRAGRGAGQDRLAAGGLVLAL